MPSLERMKELLQGFSAEKPTDPSAAWLDSLAVSRENIVQGRGTAVDSARVWPKKPGKPDKPMTPAERQKAEADSLASYIKLMKSREEISKGKAAGTFLKPEKPGKTETPTEAQMRYINLLEKMANLKKGELTIDFENIGKLKPGESPFTRGGNFPEGSTGRRVLDQQTEMYGDSLGLAEKAQKLGVKNFTDVTNILRLLGETPSDSILKETGLTRGQAEYLINMFK